MDLTINSAFTWMGLGLFIGISAAFLVPGHDPWGRVGTAFVAVVGSVLGGLIAYALRLGADPYSPAGWIVSVMGAALAMAAYHSNARIRGAA